jgi:hypothetical protein
MAGGNLLPQMYLWIQPEETYCHKYVFEHHLKELAVIKTTMKTIESHILLQSCY